MPSTTQFDPMDLPHIVYGVGFTLMGMSLLCSFYICGRVILRWRRLGMMPMTLRFPFYIAITDIMLSASLLLDQSYPAIHRVNWPDWMCVLTAVVVSFAVMSNMSLVAAVTFTTYSAVCRSRPIVTGYGDWKLLGGCALFALVMALISIPGAGASRYWCYAKNYSADKSIVIVVTLVEFTMFGLTTLFAGFVVREVYRNKARKARLQNLGHFAPSSIQTANGGLSSVKSAVSAASPTPSSKSAVPSDSSAVKKETIEDIAARKMLMFVFNYMAQWSSVVPYCLGSIFEYYDNWTVILCNIGMNCGGSAIC
ncbi:hypothetical protein HDV03_001449 [Kappamyces sp. JEL0829]|nr:hypothetical protein HDV03_001449 [Kappamyces sp. JEL0829]